MDARLGVQRKYQRIVGFQLWYWRRLLRVPLNARRSILKEISPEYSLEGLMFKLKLQTLATWWKELTHLKSPWLWERLRAGGEGDDRGWDGWMTSLTQWTWVWVNSGRWWWTDRNDGLHFWGSQRVGHDSPTELNWCLYTYICINIFIHIYLANIVHTCIIYIYTCMYMLHV